VVILQAEIMTGVNMLRDALTPDDHDWLAKQAEACRLGLNFMLSQMFKKTFGYDAAHAAGVPIWFEGKYINACDLLTMLDKNVRPSHIFEKWQYDLYYAVQRVCLKLSSFDARVLIVAAGFDGLTGDDIYDAACEAVEEARRALYGDDEDHH
jgi:hypothetical protein